MWIVRLALRRPYTFVVMALLIAIMGIVVIRRMPTDIFPEIDIPVLSMIFNYGGMSPDDMEKRVVGLFERFLTTTVNDIEHTESVSLNGIGIIKIFFQKGAKIEAATAQVTSVAQTAIRNMPPGMQPPLIIRYNASSVPIIQLSLGSKTLPEQQLFDLGINFLRPQLVTIPGVQLPYPYGGKQRQIMIDLDPEKLYAWGISPADISTQVNAQNVILPSGSAKIGNQEYAVRLNGSPPTVEALNALPMKVVNSIPVYLGDVAHVRDGFSVQTNIVHSDGKRGVLMSILKNGNASTLDVVDAIKAKLPAIKTTLPPELTVTPLFDQSTFVRASVDGVIKEACIAAGLTALLILLFLGSWRSTLIVVISIPLSILVAIIVLYALGETLNVMTLGGMALAVGILVDDATVEIENIHRNLGQKKPLVRAILDGAQQIAVPAFVSTTCICIVFLPVIFVTGAAKYLFTPLALAVVIAMMTSYFLSRTLVPTMVHYLLAKEVELYGGDANKDEILKKKDFFLNISSLLDRIRQRILEQKILIQIKGGISRGYWAKIIGIILLTIVAFYSWQKSILTTVVAIGGFVWILTLIGPIIVRHNLIWSIHEAFNRQIERLREAYGSILLWALRNYRVTISAFSALALVSTILFFFVGSDFFPQVDAGQIRLHARVPPGTRIEETEHYFARIEDLIRRTIPAEEISVILDNIGIPNSGINLSLSDATLISPADGEILVSLSPDHSSTSEYIRKLRQELAVAFPDVTFFFSPADIATQVLNFGSPAPIDIQIAGSGPNVPKNLEIAKQIATDVRKILGAVDVRLNQVVNTPDIRVDVDRTLADKVGVTQRDVASDLLISLSSSNQTAPNFWLNPSNGVNYSIFVQTPQYRINSLNALLNTPVIPDSTSGTLQPQLLSNLATTRRGMTAANITHYSITPTYDVMLGVQGRDLGSVSQAVQNVVDKFTPQLPRGSTISLRGQIESMRSSFDGLSYGLVFAIVLVYFLMVVNFQSWLDPLIILMALPGALSGIIWMLYITGTTISVPSLMGAIMSIGVATSNSILLITFANEQRALGLNALDAAMVAGLTRLRPVLMTALAMIIGMLPMSFGMSEGGEQNAPLGRAVIGGLIVATFATLFFVPAMYSILRKTAPHIHLEEELQS